MIRYKLGIDLATVNTGIVIARFKNDKWKIIHRETMVLKSFCQANIEENILTLRKTMLHFRNIQDLEIYIELGNFGNSHTTQKFGFYAGAITMIFPKTKIFFPINWQKYLTEREGGFHTTERKQLKMLSRKLVEDIIGGSKDWTEDECDAFGMIYFSDNITVGAFHRDMDEKKKKRKVK